MPIPETQLETWSHQGSVTQSSDTYQTVVRALVDAGAPYADKSFQVFLQGSYGNDTNIYAESDVDIVIRLDSIFQFDISSLTALEQQDYRSRLTAPGYSFTQFKDAVVNHLQQRFGAGAVSVGKKAIKLKGDNNLREVDVVACYEHRRYNSYTPQNTTDYVSGIVFPTQPGEIVNYPKQHSANLTSQHQATGQMLKPMVRILKNMRSRMVKSGALKDGVAPSYYVEGLFYNVPQAQYATSYGSTFANGVNWLLSADHAKLVCANRQYYLIGNSNVQWNSAHLKEFLSAACALWMDW